MGINPLLMSSATAIVEQTINSTLPFSPASDKQLKALSGYTIDIVTEPVQVHLVFTEEKLLIHQRMSGEGTDEKQADAVISGTPMALVRLGLSKDKQLNIEGSEITVTGNSDVVHKLYAFTNALDIDYEAMLAEIAGSVPAHLLGSRFRTFTHWAHIARESLEKNIQEYLQEEGKQVPAKVECEIMFDELDELTLSVDRLEARIQRLKSAADGKNTEH